MRTGFHSVPIRSNIQLLIQLLPTEHTVQEGDSTKRKCSNLVQGPWPFLHIQGLTNGPGIRDSGMASLFQLLCRGQQPALPWQNHPGPGKVPVTSRRGGAMLARSSAVSDFLLLQFALSPVFGICGICIHVPTIFTMPSRSLGLAKDQPLTRGT